ncbi:CIC11C00000001034 [Sungouiella intermedia]|uniref:CIC11C00000001034 n=1 Tax=Sungouiella intermedia TaxID=45354 RepID=A0A1L0BWM1_9ASCO|nr:CIC11C00000001034 [[Candida] intermedia]
MPETSAALIDQLVYIDNFINSGTGDTPNLDVDGQLSLDLAAFADDLFIFPDEEKPNHRDDDDDNDNNNDKRRILDLADVDRFNGDWFEHHDEFVTNVGRKPDGIGALAKINESTKQAKLNRTNHYANAHGAQGAQGDHETEHEGLKGSDTIMTSEIGDLSGLPKFPVPPGAKNSLKQAGLSLNQIDLLSALIAQHQNSLGNSIPGSVGLSHGSSSSHLPLAIAPTLASNGHTQTHSLILSDLDLALSVVSQRNGNHSSQNGQNGQNGSYLVESPGSMYSSGYSSGGTSMLSTPQIPSRGSISLGSGTPSLLTEEVKRKRNTAASARFRIKKKLKEKEMENKIEQLDEMIKNFELKINELEMENRLLKNLIIEKGNRNSDQELKLLKERVRHHSDQSAKRE